MAYDVVRSRDCDRDVELIFDHLVGAYVDLGDPIADALDHAAARILGIEADIAALGRTPFQGTLCPEVLPGLRRVTKDRAIFYFRVDEWRGEVQVLAVFFGGQDHQRHMMIRLLQPR